MLLALASSASAAVTQKQAAKKALAALGSEKRSDAVVVFGLPTPLKAGTKVTQAGTAKSTKGSTKGISSRLRSAGVRMVKAPAVLTVTKRSYFFYEDRGPFELYQHPGRVALVDAQTGAVRLSRTITWPPLLNGRLPAFLKSAGGYRSAKYQVLYRPYAIDGSAQQPRTANRNLFDQDPFGPGRPLPDMANSKAIADRLAAEHSCILRVTDTLPSFWNVNQLNLTRTYVGTLFEKLERDNGGFIDDRYGARSGETLAQSVDRLVAAGCKDMLLYVAGQGYDQGGDPVIQLGTSVMKGGLLAQQNLSASELRKLVSGRPGVTFKFKFDAPYSGGFMSRLRDLSNVLLIETPAAEGDTAFSFIPEVAQNGQMVSAPSNPAGLLEFTNCELNGFKAFFSSKEEIDRATQAQNEGVSFLAEMLARSQELCKGDGFADDLGSNPQLYAAKRGSGKGTNLPPKADPQSVAATEDTPKAITLTGSDPDGDPLTFTITKQPDHGTLSGSGANVTYTPAANYNGPDDFSFKVTDSKGAESNTAKVSIDVGAGNDAPVVTNSQNATPYTEQAAAVVVDGNLTVSDVDDTQLEGATVRVSSGFQAGDKLNFTNTSAITGSYNAGTGVLTLTGSDTVANYQAALRSIKYENQTENNPSSPKTIEFKVNDGTATSAASTKNIAVTGVNDNPVLDTTDAALAYSENSGAQAVDNGITVADSDSATLAGATVQITGNFAQPEDDLVFTNQNGISGSYNDATGTLTLSGTASVANYQAALRSVKYQNTSDNPSTATRTVSFQVNDGAGANNLSNVATRDISVSTANDAPVVTTSAGNTSYTEGSPATTVDGSLTITDADDTNIEGGQVRISSGFQSGDDLVFVNTANISGVYNTGTGVLTLSGTDTVANYQAALRSVKYRHTGDNPATSKTVEFKVNDGDADSNLATKGLAITPVNDAPTVNTTATALTYTEGSGPQPADSGLGLSDPDSTQIQGATVQITGNFVSADDQLSFTTQNGITGSYNDTNGTLTLSGTSTVANYQAALRSVAYENVNDNPSGTKTVSFQATDAEGAASNVGTRDINFTAANDAPVVDNSAGATSYTEGDPGTTVDAAVTVSDADDTNLEGGQVRISTGFQSGDDLVFVNQNGISGVYNTGTGVLTLTGTASVANYQTALRSIQYRHTGDNPTGGKTVEFKVNDGDVDSATDTKTINITGVNDSAVLTTTAAALSYSEGSGAVPVDSGLTLDDPENHDITGATVKITGNFAQAEDDLVFVDANGITGSYDDATGTLTLSGTASEATYQTALRSVAYQNTSDNPSTTTRTVSFKTTGDTGSPSQGSNTATRDINVSPANDAPVVTPTNGSTAYSEGGAATTVDGGLTVSDADDTNIEGGQVRISSGFQSGDDLVFVNQNGISGVYNTGTGVLTLTGTASVANYQTALRSIQFQSTNDAPVGSKTIEFKVNDGDVDSNAPTKEITVTPVNDAPTLNTSGGSASFVEDGSGAVAVDPNITLTDPDSANMSGATVSITGNFDSSEDQLLFANTANITGNYNSGTGVLTLTGTDTVANYQAALRTVQYNNTDTVAPNTATRTVSFQATDSSAAASNTATRNVTVAQSNDAPVVNTTGGDTAYTEGGAATAIDSGITVTDPEDTNLEGGQVRISSGFQSGDDLVFVNQNGISGVYNTGTGVLTLSGTSSIANYQTALRSIQFQSTNDAPATSKTVEFKVNDGDVDSNLATKGLAITPVNDAPTLNTSGGSAAFVEDSSGAVNVDPNLTLTDPDSANMSGATVEITTGFDSSEDQLVFVDQAGITGAYNSGTGVLTLSGTASVADYQAALRSVKYNNTDTVAPDTTTRTVRFQATDSSAATSNFATRNVTIASVNDAPVVATSAGSTPYTEDDPATTIDGSLTVTDQDDTNIEGGQVRISSGFQTGDDLVFVNQSGISGVYNTGTGVLTLTGTSSVANYQAALRSIKFRSTNQQPVTSKTVEFKVNDGDVDSNLATKELAVTPTNDGPIVDATNTTLSYTENDPATAIDSGLTIDDLENDNLSGGSASITANYQAGQDVLAWTDNNLADNITLDGVNSNAQTVVLTGLDTEANYEAALRAVTYQNVSDNPITANRTVTFSATDQPGLTGSDTRTISVTAVDDPPVAVNDSATVLEDAAATSVPVLTNDTDPDGGPKTISSATDPANGTVVLTGGSPGAHTGLTYQPDPNYCNDPSGSPDTFSYTVNGGSNATVSMTVTCVNDAPVANNDTFGGAGNVNDQAIGNTTMQVDDTNDGGDDNKPAPTNPHTEIQGDILANDTDVDGPTPRIVQSAGSDAGATNGQTADGGTVTIEPDGDFVYQPPASVSCDNGTDTFNYKISDQQSSGAGPIPGTAIGTVTINLEGCVWYVNNNAPGNAGTSTQPFDTLAQAETASGANHTVFVFDGDNTSTGYQTGYQMNSGERLIGEHEGLVVDADQGGSMSADTLHPANPGAHPTLSGTNEDVVALDDGNEVRGFNLDPVGTGSGIAGASGDTGGGTIDDVNILDTAVAGSEPLLELDSTTGTFNISNLVVNNQAAVSPPNTATGVRLNNAGTVNFAPSSQISIGINGAKGLDAASTGLGTSTFDDITVAGSGVGGVRMDTTTGTVALGDGTGSDLSLTTTSGSEAALRVNSHTGGALTVDSAGADDLHATGGPALDTTATSGATYSFDDVDSTNSANDGINIDGLGTGTFSATSGDIGGYAGIGFDLNAGSGAITYPGTFANGSGTYVSEITGRSGGVVSLSGSISDTNDSGGGINVTGNTGGSTVFSGATKQFNTGTVDGVDFQSSDGHTLVLSGGGTDIDTTSGRGVDAETSGTIQISGSGNTVLTDTGRAINVANTDFAAADMTFDSVRVNSDLAGSGPDIGIRLDTTGNAGNLAVTGTGGDCTSTASCTGGVIHNTTSDGVRLTSTAGTSLTDMYIGDSDGTGIYAPSGTSNNTFNDLHIHNNGDAVSAPGVPEAGIAFGSITGTNSITGPNSSAGTTTVEASRNNQIEWLQASGTGTLNISNTDVINGGQGAGTGSNGLSVESQGTATATLNVGNGGASADSLIDNNPAAAMVTNATGAGATINSDVDNVDFDGPGSFGLSHLGRGTTVWRVNNSDFNGFNVAPNNQSAASTVTINPIESGSMDGTFTNNRIGTAGVNGSGALRNFGLVLGIEDGSDADLNISNNTIRETAQEGIFLYARDFLLQGGSVSNVNLTLRDNVVSEIENLPSPDTFTNLNGIEVEAAFDSNVCADIANNDSESVGSSSTTGTELRTRQLDDSIFRLEGLPADSGNNEPLVESFLASRNPLIPVTEIDAGIEQDATPEGYKAQPGDCPMPITPP
ncbi:MAG TPA: tandem-95 repeat protein [Thermoleophilaceae bacterium]|jgi:hypothetical protein